MDIPPRRAGKVNLPPTGSHGLDNALPRKSNSSIRSRNFPEIVLLTPSIGLECFSHFLAAARHLLLRPQAIVAVLELYIVPALLICLSISLIARFSFRICSMRPSLFLVFSTTKNDR